MHCFETEIKWLEGARKYDVFGMAVRTAHFDDPYSIDFRHRQV